MDAGGAVLALRRGPVVGLVAQLALLGALSATVGLSPVGWFVGLACSVLANAAVTVGLARSGLDALGIADLVTLTRAVLACAVAGLVADAFLGRPVLSTLVALTVIALLLDAVDGWVARHTRTATTFGARFDGEVDAFLILVLSVYVARSVGAWVLAIGAARYLFALAGWVLPWLRSPLPYRYWGKVVAATQGIVLTVAAADVAPRWVAYTALVVALAMLAESFGWDVWWLWQRRSDSAAPAQRPAVVAGLAVDLPDPGPALREAGSPAPWGGRRTVVAVATNALALLLVWVALVAPNQTHLVTPAAFLRIPVEGLALAGLALALPARARRAMALVAGVLLGLLTLVKVMDMGFFATFDRPFNVVTDAGYLSSGVDLVQDLYGPVAATVAAVGGVLLVAAVLVCMSLSVRRLTGFMARHRRWSVRALCALAVLWVAGAMTGLQVGPAAPMASTSAGSLAVGKVSSISAGIRDQQRFEAAVEADRLRDAPGRDLLAGLRGKDVVLAFVESYGRIAVQGSPSARQVRAVLDAGTRRLRASGFSSRSAFLTSPTFGGLSWLAHATLQSGLWVNNQPRYDRLLSGHRMTLSQAFGRAGWRTVTVMPQVEEKWSEGKRFYRFDKVHGRDSVDYRGPKFGWAAVPDQFALRAFQRLELAERRRPPVMAQIELVSSHAPWAPLPHMVDWSRLGDGSVYKRIHDRGDPKAVVWGDPEDIEGGYIDSITYSLRSLISFVERYGDDDLVLIVLGDHQPATVVTGHSASHDVPITVVARDPEVIDQISAWRWQAGMRPGSRAPVWPMDTFRNRFLAAYSPRLSSSPQQQISAQR